MVTLSQFVEEELRARRHLSELAAGEPAEVFRSPGGWTNGRPPGTPEPDRVDVTDLMVTGHDLLVVFRWRPDGDEARRYVLALPFDDALAVDPVAAGLRLHEALEFGIERQEQWKQRAVPLTGALWAVARQA